MGNLFVVSGPAGVGKGTLVARVMEAMPNAWLSVSATTRTPRPGEVDGVHYRFLSDQEFDELVANDGFLEWAQVHTARYGTPRDSVIEHMDNGEQVILEIDVQGAFQVKEKMPACHLIFVEPPSLTELRSRLEGRGTEAPDVVDKRMQVAEVELARKKEYDYTLVNDDLDEATADLLAIIQSFADED